MSTYAKFDQSHTDDPRWIAAGAEAFALHVAAVVWCDRLLTDGAIPREMALRVSLAVPPDRAGAAIEALLEHEFWARDGDAAYRILDFLTHALPAEQVKRTRARWAADKQRRRQHDMGDHALCRDPKYCPAIRDDSTVESTQESDVDSTVESSRIDQTKTKTKTRPDQDQTRPDRKEGRSGSASGIGMGEGSAPGGRRAASAAARAASAPPDDDEADDEADDSTPSWNGPRPDVVPRLLINGKPAHRKAKP